MWLISVLFCSVSSLTCYILLLIPATILRTPLFAIICFAFGYGPAPLLLVIIAPFLTEHISTALGLHKSLEMAGSTLMQTVSPVSISWSDIQYAGLILDFEKTTSPEHRLRQLQTTFEEIHIIWIFVGLNVLYIFSNLIFIQMDRRMNFGNIEHAKLHEIKEGYKALERRASGEEYEIGTLPARIARSELHVWRVRLYIFLCGLVLVATWISFGLVIGYRGS